jgi:hypothetical protein
VKSGPGNGHACAANRSLGSGLAQGPGAGTLAWDLQFQARMRSASEQETGGIPEFIFKGVGT